MANRYFNKQTTNARQALAQGGSAKVKDDPRRNLGPKKPKPSLGGPTDRPKGGRPQRKGTPSIPEFPIGPGPKSVPRRRLPRFKKKDTTDREKITRDRIKRNEIKDRLDKLKEKIKPGPVGTGLNPDKLKKSSKNLKDQISGRGK
jgi:hypothetical protein